MVSDELELTHTRPSDPAEAGITRSQNRAGRRGRMPERHPGSEASYEVGYGRPPKHTQFKPGKSGNPKGRSPQSHNLKTIVKQVLDEPMPIPGGWPGSAHAENRGPVRVTLARALKGDPKALASLIIMMKQSGYGTEAVENALELLQGVDHEGDHRGIPGPPRARRIQQSSARRLTTRPRL